MKRVSTKRWVVILTAFGFVSSTMAFYLRTRPKPAEPAEEAPAADPAPATDSICDRAYETAREVIRQTQDRAPHVELPPRERFIAACQLLPESTRPCLVFDYAATHQQACAAALEAVEGPTRDQFRSLMRPESGQ